MKRGRRERACSIPAALVLILILVHPSGLRAAGEQPRAYHLNAEFFTHLAQDSASLLTSPFSWKASDVLCVAGILGASGLIYAFDRDIQDWVQARRTAGSEKAMAFFSNLGDAGYLAAFLAGLYVAGEIAPSYGLRKTAVLGLESLAVTGVVVLGFKFLAGRARPDVGKGPNYFEPFSFRSSFLSLPSGHSASAFAAAATIAAQSDSTAVDVTAYTLAALVALSRVHNNEHWASDVFLGSAIGYFIGRGVAGLNRDAGKTTSVSLAVSPQSVTLTFQF